MVCNCEPDDDVRKVCRIAQPTFHTCPVRIQTAVWIIDNDSDFHASAIKGDFEFVSTFVKSKEDFYKIIYTWNKQWLEHEYDFDETKVLDSTLEELKKSRDREIKAEYVINYHKNLYKLSLNENVIREKMIDEYEAKESLYKQRLEDIKAEIEYYKQKIKNESVPSGHSIHRGS